ncbi:MAG: MATE family efflux transporter, partial [Clostridia bacterium]
MLGMSVYILADTFFVANNVGNAGITALNIVLPFFSLLNGFGLILGVGGATRYAQALGAGDKEKAQRIFT